MLLVLSHARRDHSVSIRAHGSGILGAWCSASVNQRARLNSSLMTKNFTGATLQRRGYCCCNIDLPSVRAVLQLDARAMIMSLSICTLFIVMLWGMLVHKSRNLKEKRRAFVDNLSSPQGAPLRNVSTSALSITVAPSLGPPATFAQRQTAFDPPLPLLRLGDGSSIHGERTFTVGVPRPATDILRATIQSLFAPAFHLSLHREYVFNRSSTVGHSV